MRDFAVYTACTGPYKYGLFTLIKSLLKFGYTGTIVVATNKVIDELTHLKNVEQVVLNSAHVFGNLKARIILEQPSAKFLYFDPDIIQTNPNFIPIILNELNSSNRFITNAEGIVSKSDIRRWMWNRKLEVGTAPLTDFYYNAGFFAGLFEEHKSFLKEWDKRIHDYFEPGKYFDAVPEFPLADQDVFNALIQNYPEQNITSIGMPDWVGVATKVNPFHECGLYKVPLYVHATGKFKTWTLKEIPSRYPSLYDREFYKYHIDTSVHIPSDLTFTWLQKKWLTASKILPFYNKIRTLY